MGMTDTEHFLDALWGTKTKGHIQLWRLNGRRSYYPKAVIGAAGIATGETDLYVGVALAGEAYSRHQRAKAKQAVAIAGLWLDIDVNGGPDNKTGAAPDKSAALELAHVLMPPTLIVDSGYGLHAWWLFPEVWHFTGYPDQDTAARASAQWFALHREAAGALGFTVDHAHDLARLLRIPGTLNGKGGGNMPVQFIEREGPRHHRASLLGLAAQAGDVVDPQLTTVPTGDMPVVDVGPARALAKETLEALLENSPEFKATWMHTRSADWSMSEYDLALCSIAAKALTDQQLADLIALHRQVYRDGEEKGRRRDYVMRTVAKARQQSERSRSAGFFKDRATQLRGVEAA